MTTPAHNSEAEQAVLGCILYEPDSIVDVMSIITPDDFYERVHGDVFQSMIQLYEQSRGFDLLTLADKMKDHAGLQAAGGSAYLADLATAVPTAADIERHAFLLKDKAIHRAVAVAGQAITQLGADQNLEAADVLERAEQKILSINRLSSNSDPKTLYEIGLEAYEHYAKLHEAEDKTSLLGIQTGFRELDNYLQGLEPGAFVVIEEGGRKQSIGRSECASVEF